jgi:hypothetical protein
VVVPVRCGRIGVASVADLITVAVRVVVNGQRTVVLTVREPVVVGVHNRDIGLRITGVVQPVVVHVAAPGHAGVAQVGDERTGVQTVLDAVGVGVIQRARPGPDEVRPDQRRVAPNDVASLVRRRVRVVLTHPEDGVGGLQRRAEVRYGVGRRRSDRVAQNCHGGIAIVRRERR